MGLWVFAHGLDIYVLNMGVNICVRYSFAKPGNVSFRVICEIEVQRYSQLQCKM